MMRTTSGIMTTEWRPIVGLFCLMTLSSIYATHASPSITDNTLSSTHSSSKTPSSSNLLGQILGNIRAGSRRRERSTNQGGNEMCGIRPRSGNYMLESGVRYTSRIVGGVPSEQRWPWQVLLFDRVRNRPFCGGVLLGNQHVLTAAHCFNNHDRNNIDVIIGEHDLLVKENTERNHTIDCLFIHSGYVDTVPYNNDIAMIKLKGEGLRITKDVLPVCLPEKREFKKNKVCYITGWGYTNFEELFAGKLPSVLHEAEVPLLPLKTCRQVYGLQISKRMQCAGFLEGAHRTDTCKGDSGGPLVCQDEASGRFKLWGITSWGDNHFCALEPTGPVPGVYTRVDKYLKWISHKMTTNRCP